MYVGRLEAGKGIQELLRCYASLRRELQDPPELVLGGSGRMTISQPGVRCLGPISEQEKLDGLAGAAAVVVPSRYESLSLLALEAFSQATPVLANAESEVLAGHIERSGAGFTYLDPASFIEGFRRVNADRERLGRRGLKYARRHSWKRVLDVYEQELARIQRGSQ
jgi:glycosyltransferase involved in cell wall biosynthesis